MKVVVFGSGGMLGSDLVPFWESLCEVKAFPHAACDVSNRDMVKKILGIEKPDILLFLAAATDVDRCENNRDYAFRTNTIGVEIVAQECNKLGISLVYISTIAVFDGEKDSPYDEYDLPSPMNTYGLSKYHGELAVRAFCPNHWIVRTSWLFGGGMKDMKFVAKILRKASMNDTIKVVRDCVGSPTYTADLAKGISEIVERFQFGTYHLVNGGVPASRYELARETLRIAGYSADRILPCLSSDFHLPAHRPKMEAAESIRLKILPHTLSLPDWKSSLAGYIDTMHRELAN